ncbi:MAG: hypothetical protein NZ552_02235 [Planctomycetes bacterium]|nr:hypothetical protein [Planctomycetota bacterium]
MNGPFVSWSSGQRLLLGVALLIAGAVMLVAAAGIAWRAVQRWLAVGELRAAHAQLHRGRLDEARRLAAAAAERLPREPSAQLLALDPADPQAGERLRALASACERANDRHAVLATLGLLQALAGRAVDAPLEGTGDARLLAAIRAAHGERMASWRLVAGEDPPQRQVLLAAHTVLLRQALRLRSRDDVRLHAGALLLLDPGHPRAALLRPLLLALSPAAADEELVRAVAEAREESEALARTIAALVPERRAALTARWPGLAEQTP